MPPSQVTLLFWIVLLNDYTVFELRSHLSGRGACIIVYTLNQPSWAPLCPSYLYEGAFVL